MLPVEALRLALSKEIEVIELSRKLSMKYPITEDIFLFLLGEEKKHKQLIEKKIHELTR